VTPGVLLWYTPGRVRGEIVQAIAEEALAAIPHRKAECPQDKLDLDRGEMF